MLPEMPFHDDQFFDYGATLLTAMANRHRLVLLNILMSGETSVSALATVTGMGSSALSQHLTKLRGARLVIRRRQAQTVYYSCRSEDVKRIMQTLQGLWQEAVPAQPFDGELSAAKEAIR
jgi:DNA-binding transcriptional ArsR family regulator